MDWDEKKLIIFNPKFLKKLVFVLPNQIKQQLALALLSVYVNTVQLGRQPVTVLNKNTKTSGGIRFPALQNSPSITNWTVLNSDSRIEECALGWESRSSYVTMSKTSVLKRPSHLDRWVLQTPSGNTNWNYQAFSGPQTSLYRQGRQSENAME